jgi:hypothetical protein
MHMNKYQNTISRNQSGIVSITVTVVIMFVITLIVLGFATIVRREQRQSLDRQLNTQAFYAAESGVNYAAKTIRQAVATGGSVSDKSGCASDGNYPGWGSPPTEYDIDTGNAVSVSCLLVDATPDVLRYDSIGIDRSIIVPVNSASGSPFASITFDWVHDIAASPLDATGCPSPPNFPQSGSWSANCDAGVLRVDLVPVGAPFNRQYLIENTMTAFLYPGSAGGGGSLNYIDAMGANQGKIVRADCGGGSTVFCQVNINIGAGSYATNSYIARIKSIYRENKVEISGSDSAGSTSFVGTQAEIDSTGKANDVLRRIKVRIPLIATNNQLFPEYALQSVDTICKKLLLSNITEENCASSPTAPSIGAPSFVASSGPGGGGSFRSDPPPSLPPCSSAPPDAVPFEDCRPRPCSSVPGGTPGVDCVGDGGGPGLPPCSSAPPDAVPFEDCRPRPCSSVPGGTPGVDCVGSSGSARSMYAWRFENNSTIDPALVEGCVWDWGHGSPPAKTTNVACKNGESTTHAFPSVPAIACYAVTLTVSYNNGSPPTARSQWIRVPRSSSAPCP